LTFGTILDTIKTNQKYDIIKIKGGMDMKKVVLGFILGVITTISVTAIAANIEVFQAQKATFDVFVNGKKFESKNPTIVVEGRTYLPLKAIGDVLGVDVQWNNDLRRVEINKDNTDVKEVDSDMQSNANRETKSGEIFKEVKQRGSTVCVKEIDGEQYATPSVFGLSCVRHDGDKVYIVIPGREPVLVKVGDKLTEYAKKDIGNILVKLSSLGLEAEINGDTVILRYK